MFAAAILLMGYINEASVAAHAIAIQIASMTFMVPMGIGQAATVRVGLGLWSARCRGITRAGWTGFVLGIGFMAAMALVICLFPGALIRIFLDPEDAGNAEVLQLAVQFLLVAAVFQIVDGAQVVGTGMLRGLQDTDLADVVRGVWLLGGWHWCWLLAGVLVAAMTALASGWGSPLGLGIVAGLVLIALDAMRAPAGAIAQRMDKRQYAVILAKRRRTCHFRSVFQQKYMADNLRLLLDAILRQLPARFQAVIIAAKRMAFQRQENALLMLPDMDQFVDEQSLQMQFAVAKIVAEQLAFGMEPQMPVGGHRDLARLEPPPFALVDADFGIIQRIAKNRPRQRNLARSSAFRKDADQTLLALLSSAFASSRLAAVDFFHRRCYPDTVTVVKTQIRFPSFPAGARSDSCPTASHACRRVLNSTLPLAGTSVRGQSGHRHHAGFGIFYRHRAFRCAIPRAS